MSVSFVADKEISLHNFDSQHAWLVTKLIKEFHSPQPGLSLRFLESQVS